VNRIEQLLSQPESKTLEFKQDLSSPKPILKTLVAFANTAGGRLIVGVDDGKNIVGVDDPLDAEERICNRIADAIFPRLVPNVELMTVDNKTLLIVEVYLSGSRPHWLRAEGQESGVYVRLGSSNRQADRELIAELRRGVEGVAFDEMPMPALTMDDLDIKTAQEVFGQTRSLDEKTLTTLKLVTKEQGRLVPTHGGVLLFGKERLFHFSDAWIQCGRFIGTDKVDIFDHIDLHDHLPQAVDSIMLFLKKHAMRGADFSEIRRKDVWSIPLGILREAVINALVHSDYSQRGAPVRIAFFDDRIEIENPGILLPGMTIEDMKQGVSKIRNPVIARVFRELKLIEQWGSGIPHMLQQAEQLGLPPLKIMEIGMRLRLVVPLLQPLVLAPGTSRQNVSDKTRPQQATQSPTQSPTQSADPVSAVLQLLRDKPLSSSELRAKLNLKHRPTFRENYLHPALAEALIEMTIPNKPNSRLQKYRLTGKGREALVRKNENEGSV
jgi:predicted HTH transcriptional regulator